MGDIFGGSRLTGPHTVTTLGPGPVSSADLNGPQVVAIYADGGDAEIIFSDVSTVAAVAGQGWIVKSGEWQEFLVQSAKPFLHVITGTVRHYNG